MLNFREELNKIKNGTRKRPTIQESAERFLTEVLDALQQCEDIRFFNVKELMFELVGKDIYVKGKHNITSISVLKNHNNAQEIFQAIKKMMLIEFSYLKEENMVSFVVPIE